MVRPARLVALLAALVAVAAVLAAPAQAAGPRAATTPWLLVSDVHFDPFAGADAARVARLQAAPVRRWGSLLAGGAPSPWGQDTNATLLASSLRAMRRAAPDPPVVLIAGDLLAHDFQQTYEKLAPDASPADYRAFVDKTIAYLAVAFGAAYPRAQFVVTLGNEDAYCGDYEVAPDSPFLLRAARAWRPLVNRRGRAPGFVRSFRHLGAYTARLPIPGLRAVAFDDVFWSTEYDDACGTPGTDPAAGQAGWLRDAVAGLRPGERAWLVTHIPPGIDVYATLQGSGAPVPLLTPVGESAIEHAVGGGRVPAVVFGHLHMSTYRVHGTTPMLGLPSISPVFDNNPAFTTARVRRDGTIADFTVHALNLGEAAPAWRREYRFRDAYDLPAFDAASLRTLTQRLATDAGMRHAYERRYVSGGKDAITDAQYPAYACGAIALDPAAFTACLSAPSP